jgi:hypothetical protein
MANPLVQMAKDRAARREYDNRWYHSRSKEWKERRLARKRLAARRITEAITRYKTEIGCRDCPERHPACLDLHHPDGEKEFNIGDAARLGYSLERVMAEAKRCAVLCSNCHRKIHYLSKAP